MPYFTFACRACGEIFDFLSLPGDEEQPSCPACGGERLDKRPSAPGLAATRRSVSEAALHATGGEILSNPDAFARSMKALENKTGAKLTRAQLEGAMDRLKSSGSGSKEES